MILSSCDNYEDTWAPFFICLKKYWTSFEMPIYLSTETKNTNFTGCDIRCPLSGGNVYKQWSERLEKLLNYIEEDYILFMLDDFWLTERVDEQFLWKVLDYMKSNKDIGFVCLKQEIKDYCSDKEKANAVDCEYPDIWEYKPQKSFRITTQAGLWRKDYLKKILRRHESAWYFETRATWRSRFYSERVFDVKRNVLTYPIGGTIGGGKLYEDYLDLYPVALYEETMNKRGTIKYGEKRTYPKEPRGFGYYFSLFKSVLPKW